jgi:hypothetical protein
MHIEPSLSPRRPVVNRLQLTFALLLCSLLAQAALGASAHAQPRGLVLAPRALPSLREQELRREIRALAQKKPAVFAAVHELEREVPRLYAARRGRLAPLGPAFKALGPDALLPMLSLLSFDAHESEALSRGAALSLRVGLLEAVGQLRDARALPVLLAVVQHDDASEPEVTRAAVSALGAYGSDDVVAQLLALSRSRDGRQDAVRAGLGNCRRSAIAHELASSLSGETRAAAQRALIDSLGAVGNAWAWKTPQVREHAAEEAEVRRTAASALVQAYVRGQGSLRDAASNALMVVDAPETAALIATARQHASREQQAALDALSARFARNPTR